MELGRDFMKVKVSQLQKGSILKNDVLGPSQNPIIPANTAINETHIEILKAFLIDEVEVETTSSFTTKETPRKETQQFNALSNFRNINFDKLYIKAVNLYKTEFQLWQTGLPVNIAHIRSFMIPLLKEALKNKNIVRTIHQLSNKEEYFYHHPIAVGVISSWIAKEQGYDEGQCLQVAIAGCLADCGMAKINESLYKNTRALTPNEWNEIKKHPLYSYQMVKDIPLLKKESKIAILQHHERLDGTGYPIGESGRKIQPLSQIIAIADTYHAMTTDRLFKEKTSPYKTLQMMEEDEFGKFDFSILNTLTTLIASLPVGTKVKLSDGQTGEIYFTKPHALTRPLVKVQGAREIIDLETNRQIYIESVLE